MSRCSPGRGPGAGARPAGPPGRTLVAIDSSDNALAALQAAVELAATFEASLTVLHVAVPRARAAVELSPTAARRAEALARAAGERILEQARATVGSTILITTELAFGEPGETICRRAALSSGYTWNARVGRGHITGQPGRSCGVDCPDLLHSG
jgi:hypothetical protein